MLHINTFHTKDDNTMPKPTFDGSGNLIVEPKTDVKRDKRRVVRSITITDVLSSNPLMTYQQEDEIRNDDVRIASEGAPAVHVYFDDIVEDIPIGNGTTITREQFRFAMTMIWAHRAPDQE